MGGEEEELLFLVCDCGELCGGDGGWEWGYVEFRADQLVEVADGADGRCFVVFDGDGEEFFCGRTISTASSPMGIG